MKKAVSCLIFSLFVFNIYAQQNVIDSLKKELETEEIDTVRFKILSKLGYNIFQLSSPQEGLNYAFEMQKIASKIPDKMYEINALVLTGYGYGTLNKIDSAFICYDSALSIHKKYEIEEQRPLITISFYKAILYKKQGKLGTAIKEWEKIEVITDSLVFIEGLDYYNRLINTSGVLGGTYREVGKFELSIKKYLKALKLADSTGYRHRIPEIELSLAGSYLKIKNDDKAEKYTNSALKQYKERNDKDGLSVAYFTLGNIYFTRKQYREALDFYFKSLEIRESGIAYIGISATYYAKKDYANALKYTKKSREYNSRNIGNTGNNKYREAIMLINIAKYSTKMNEFDSAKFYVNQANIIADNISSVIIKREVFGSYIELYKKVNNADSIYFFAEKYIELNDSILNQEKIKQISDLETKYETEKKEAENARLKAENAQKEAKVEARNSMLMGGSATLIALIIALVIFITYNRKIKQHRTHIDTLYKEHAHRTKNQFSTLVSLQNRQLRQLEETVATSFLLETRNQINTMSLVHKELNQNSSEYQTEIALNDYLRDLTYNIVSSYGKNMDDFQIKTDLAHIKMEANRCSTLGLIVNELVSNALKYAYEDIEKPMLFIGLKVESKVLRLTVQDNGKGFEASDKKITSKGLNLVESLTKQLQGDLKRSTDNGTRYEITFTN